MSPEHAKQNEIRNALAGLCILFRANVGQAWTGVVLKHIGGTITLANARPFSTGLPRGFGDLFGLTFDGRFLRIEVKTAKGRVSKEQAALIAAVRRAGGRAGVARSVEEALAILEQPLMAVSAYQRERKRIYEESEDRGRGYRKRALAALDREFGVQPVRRAGRIVALEFESGETSCRKKKFTSQADAQVSLDQIASWQGDHVKPTRAYECQHCGLWHLTHRA